MFTYQIVELTKDSLKLVEKEASEVDRRHVEPELQIQRSGRETIRLELLGADDSASWVVQESVDGIHWTDLHLYKEPFFRVANEGQATHLFRAARRD